MALPIIILAFTIVLALFYNTAAALDSKIRTKLATMQNDARVKLANVAPAPVTKTQNSFYQYQEIHKTFGNPPKWIYDAYKPDFSVEKAEVAKYLKEKIDTIEAINRATKKPNYYDPRILDFSDPRMTIPQHKNAAYLLALDARDKGRKDNIRTAIENILTIGKLADHSSQCESLICVLIGFACQGIQFSAAENIWGPKA